MLLTRAIHADWKMQALRVLLHHTEIDKPIRFACSDIAGITGYHPWSDMIELVDKYLYQGLSMLRDLDAAALGIKFVDIESQVQDILHTKLQQHQSREVQVLYEQLQTIKNIVQDDQKVLTNQQQTKQMLKEVQILIEQDPVMKQTLTVDERKLILREYEGRIKTTYGIRCEEKALNKYEEVTGFSVNRRNDQFYTLEVLPLLSPCSDDDEGRGDEDDNEFGEEIETEDAWRGTKGKRGKGKSQKQKQKQKQDEMKGQKSIVSFFGQSANSTATFSSSEVNKRNDRNQGPLDAWIGSDQKPHAPALIIDL